MRLRQRQAHEPAAFAHHEVHVFGPHLLGGHDQIAFVLAILVVDDDDHAPGADFFEDFRNRRKAHGLTPRSAKSRST